MATIPKQTFNGTFTSLSSTLGSGGAWQPAISWAPNGLTDPTTTSWSMNPAWGPTSAADANVFSTSNGVLSIAIKPTPADVKSSDVGGAPFLSGELTTHDTFSQTYGYFEMSAKMPGTPGMQAAFWLLPQDGSWPPELDAVEVLGSQPGTAVDTAHSQASGSHTANPHWAGISDASKTFHTYGVDWEADKITWYVDGKQTAQEDTPADMHKPMYMLLSTIAGASSSWVGAPAAGTSDAMQVAWVHAYASMPDLSAGASPAPDPAVPATGGTTNPTTASAVTAATVANPGSSSPASSATPAPTSTSTADPGKAASGSGGTVPPPPMASVGAASTVTNPTTTSPAGSAGSVAPTQGTSTMASNSSTALASSARGGSLLPSGYLSTSGNQVVDAAGNPVRIDSIGWYGTDGPAGSALQGLWSTSYGQILDSIKGGGFNTVRIPWSNADLNTPFAGTNQLGGVDWTQNADLKGLTTLQVFQKIVSYAGQIGLKVIFDHHTDDGSGGQQPNGLWIDKGPGTNGTDGAGVQGTVDAAKFQADWVQFAKTFAGNSTVIGFDLDNEPTAQSATWGGGGATDIQKMYTDVGNAIQAVSPSALMIDEGLITPDGQGGYPQTLAGVKGNPVTLNTPNKVLYSVHSYPAEIGGGTDASGPAAVKAMTDNWGYVVAQNIAPVWVGEMGSNMTSAGSQTWAKTLLGYMNGQDGAQGGPTFSGSQQPIGGSWWNIGWENGAAGTGAGGGNPDGNQDAWGPGHYRPLQQAVTDQMLFKPASGSSTAAPATAATNSATSGAGSTIPVATASSVVSSAGPAPNGSSTGSANPVPAASGSSTPPPPPASSTGAAAANPDSTSPTGSAAPAVVGTGADTLVLNLSEDAYQGDAQFQFTVDGKAVGSAQSVTTLHGKGQSETFNFKGDWSGAHAFGVTFTNDAWGGSADVDRNLYIDSATFDGTAVQSAAALYGNGTVTFGTTASQPPQAGAAPAQPPALQAAGTSQTATPPASTVPGSGATPPAPGIGTAATGLSNTASPGSGDNPIAPATATTNAGSANPAGTAAPPTTSTVSTPSPAAVGTGPDTLVLTLSEGAASQGDAQFQLTVDGKAVGPAQSVTAPHSQGQHEAFTYHGDWGTGSHSVGVSFSNPGAGSTADLTRTLYLDSASYDGQQIQGLAPFTRSSPIVFALTPNLPPSSASADTSGSPSGTLTVMDSSSSGSAAVPLIASGSQTDHPSATGTVQQLVSNGTNTVTSSGSVTGEAATLGIGAQKLVLVNPRQMVLTGGSGADTVTANSGLNRVIAGSGSFDVTGGSDATGYVLHAGGGSLTIENFDAGKGDTLTVDKALQGALTQASDGHGGTLLSFGIKQGSIDLIGHAALSPSNIAFI